MKCLGVRCAGNAECLSKNCVAGYCSEEDECNTDDDAPSEKCGDLPCKDHSECASGQCLEGKCTDLPMTVK
jgi:hypothetical protein